MLTVLASQSEDEGCSAMATVYPPAKATTAAAAEIMSHQGTEPPVAGRRSPGQRARVTPGGSGQSSETVMVTSMLPRVAFEYGHTW